MISLCSQKWVREQIKFNTRKAVMESACLPDSSLEINNPAAPSRAEAASSEVAGELLVRAENFAEKKHQP